VEHVNLEAGVNGVKTEAAMDELISIVRTNIVNWGRVKKTAEIGKSIPITAIDALLK